MNFASHLNAFDLILSFFLSRSFAEADYTLDDSFWNDESPVGKFEFTLIFGEFDVKAETSTHPHHNIDSNKMYSSRWR